MGKIGLFYILLALSLNSLIIAQESEDVRHPIDTSYVLISSIKESCKNIVFTDSMFRAWNAALVENITMSNQTYPNDRLMYFLPMYEKGDNFRLSFCKVLNDDSLITKNDFIKGFFIIEEKDGFNPWLYRYLLIDTGKLFTIIFYQFNFRELAWYQSRENITIRKSKFLRFFNRIKKANKQGQLTNRFIVTKFTNEKIESFFMNSDMKRWGDYILPFYSFINIE